MPDLPASLLGHACRVFLARAYANGEVPAKCQPFLQLAAEANLDEVLRPPVCERIAAVGAWSEATPQPSRYRGYALRLGSRDYPNVKLKAIWHEGAGRWVFMVDTHDAIRLPPSDPDYPRLRELQVANRRLKEQVEQTWEKEGLLTSNALLRQGLES